LIAALYVEKNGCYYGLPNVDPWDIERDARRYQGPFPVVAHPPCERWGRFSEGSPMLKNKATGDDNGCFSAALASLRQFGGVLEHPAHSKAWAAFGIPSPPRVGWLQCGENEWTCEVEQGHYGHKARKKTWLLVVGPKPPELIWGSSGQRLPENLLAKRGYESARRRGIISSMGSKQRQRTPIEFRDLLLLIAEASNETRKAVNDQPV
jgi:hypothetical protein